ncbi:MAG TPA: thiamine biosynthesis protein ThiC, partial [Desulfobulbaceae bacterium]|nr:thiamine biosynthesis protein ThiC [Desulfobulbaceae bacterium]
MAAARSGIVTEQMRQVLRDEKITEEALVAGLAEGRIVIPANREHKNLVAKGIGANLCTKINVNLGVSEDCCRVEKEVEKVRRAVALKADAIMDLSTFGDTRAFRREAVAICPVMIGTVPVYDAVARYGKDVGKITVDDFFEVVRMHAEDGVDFMTIHAGLTQEAVTRLRKNPRLTHVVSRGGSLLLDWMERNQAENPFYEHFDRLLGICREYDVTLSLGDGLRPGSLRDATDAAQIQELIILGELTKAAWQRDVQVMIEG